MDPGSHHATEQKSKRTKNTCHDVITEQARSSHPPPDQKLPSIPLAPQGNWAGRQCGLAETCKRLLGPYGGRVEDSASRGHRKSMRIDAHGPAGAAAKKLMRLRVADQSLLPFVSEAIVAGAAQHLEKLRVEGGRWSAHLC